MEKHQPIYGPTGGERLDLHPECSGWMARCSQAEVAQAVRVRVEFSSVGSLRAMWGSPTEPWVNIPTYPKQD